MKSKVTDAARTREEQAAKPALQGSDVLDAARGRRELRGHGSGQPAPWAASAKSARTTPTRLYRRSEYVTGREPLHGTLAPCERAPRRG